MITMNAVSTPVAIGRGWSWFDQVRIANDLGRSMSKYPVDVVLDGDRVRVVDPEADRVLHSVRHESI
jgi:hypothetical protein